MRGFASDRPRFYPKQRLGLHVGSGQTIDCEESANLAGRKREAHLGSYFHFRKRDSALGIVFVKCDIVV
jgi:hypothetical protein